MSTVDYLMSHVPPLVETPSIPAVPAAVETLLLPISPHHGDSVAMPEPFDGMPSADLLPLLPNGFTHPTSHILGNAEEPNSNRPDALPPSSMAEDYTEGSCPLSTLSYTPASANVVTEADVNEIQMDKGNDSNGPHRTRRAHILSTRNTVANSIGNNSKENGLSNLASKCSHDTNSSARAGQQANPDYAQRPLGCSKQEIRSHVVVATAQWIMGAKDASVPDAQLKDITELPDHGKIKEEVSFN
ncbi:hypothetical protein BDR07DRAFT_1380776 [Suillus spraguei]|nr:hypothetical protein BDR07DRAFT_1380776 [Suillus spraguei]